MNGGAVDRPLSARCVVWHPDGCGVDPELASLLTKRGLDWTDCHNEFAALAAICGGAAEHNIILLVEPAQLRALPEFLDVAAKYRPRVVYWSFEPPQKLRAATAEQLRAALKPLIVVRPAMTPPSIPAARPAQPIIEPAAPRARPAPRLRLTGDEPISVNQPAGSKPLSDAKAGADPSAPPAKLLSDEELEMLLAADDETRQA